MPLDKVEIRVPFGGGLDSKTDHKQVIPGQLLELKNGVFSDLKQITKRNGFLTPFSLLTVGWYAHGYDTIKEGSAIYRRGDELLITARQQYSDQAITNYEDGWYVYSHDPVNNEWKNIGTRQPLRLGVEVVTEATSQWEIPDVARAGDFLGYAWMGRADPAAVAAPNRNVHLSILDIANNATLIDNWDTDVSLSANHVEGVHITGIDATDSIFYLWLAVPATNDIYLSMTPTDDLAFPGLPVGKIADLNATTILWDVCTATLTGSGVCSVVAYEDNSVPPNINVRWFNEFGNFVLLRTIDDDPKGAITVFEAYNDQAAQSMVVVSWQSATDGKIYAQTYTQAGVAYAGPFIVDNVDFDNRVRNITGCRDTASDAYVLDSSFCRFYVEVANNNTNTRPDSCVISQSICEFDGTNRDDRPSIVGSCLGSKAWEYEDKARVWVVHDSSGTLDNDPGADTENPEIQNTYFLNSTQGTFQNWAAGAANRTDARCLGGRAGGQSYRPSLSAVVSPATNEYLFAGLRKEIIITPTTGATWNSVAGITTQFGVVAQSSTELGPTTQTGGGFVGDADGRFQENNFHLYPECLIADVTVAAGVAVNWLYCVVFEWMDREGQIHRSQPSLPVGVGALYGNACADGDHVDIYFNTLSQGDPERRSRTRCVLYRTLDAGDVFYRLPESSHTYNLSPVVDSNTGGGGPAWSDAVISENASLYTTGGIVGNICPPPASIMNVRQDRVFLVPDDDRTNIWFSKTKQAGVAVSFSDFFTKRVSDGGDITALETMDTRQIVFKASEIRAFSGNGPLDTGVGSFGEDYMITSDVGCVDRASVVWTDKGIMFKSNKGIYLLGRNLQTSYVGAPVEAYNNYTVLKAELVEDKNQVRFLLEDNTDMLVYDYLVNQWSVFDSPFVGETHEPWGTVDSAIWQDNYVMIHNDGTVFREGVTNVDLTDTYIPLDLTTSWIKLTGLQGYQRVWWISFLGDVYGFCTINYEIYYDYVDANPQTGSITVDAGFSADPPAQFRVMPRFGNGRCQAFKIRLYDQAAAVPAGSQKGYSISDVMIQIGKLPGVMRQGGLKTR